MNRSLSPKMKLWLRYYLDNSNPETFFNASSSAKAAGYKCTSQASFENVGAQIFKKLQDRISQWMDDEGLSETHLMMKLISLINAKQFVFHKIKGRITKEVAPDGVIVMAESHKMPCDKNKEKRAYDDGYTIVAIPVEALETQRKALDMAFKLKGMYVKDNEQRKPEVIVARNISPERREILNKAYQQVLKDRNQRAR